MKRSTAADTASVKKTTAARAAKCIARFWEKHREFTSVKLVDRFPLTKEKCSSITFQELGAYLRERDTFFRAKECLQRVNSMCGGGNAVNTLDFMNGFMMVSYPANFFESMGDAESTLHKTGTEMVDTFESLCRSIKQNDTAKFVSLTGSFLGVMGRYKAEYSEWKESDREKRATRCKHGLRAFYGSIHLLAPGSSKLRTEYEAQIARIEGLLKMYLGEEAMIQFRDANKPNGESDVHTGNSGVYSTEQLAHEVWIDPTFRISDCCDVAFKQVCDTFNRSFWASLISDLKLSRPCYARMFRILREMINDIERAGNRVDIDVSRIEEHVANNEWSWDDCRSLIRKIMSYIDVTEEGRAKWIQLDAQLMTDPSTVFCDMLMLCQAEQSAAEIRSANRRLDSIAPVIAEHGAVYERNKFVGCSTERTAAWIKAAVARVGNSYDTVMMDAAVDLIMDPTQPFPETFNLDAARFRTWTSVFKKALLRGSVRICAVNAVPPNLLAQTRELLDSDETIAVVDSIGDMLTANGVANAQDVIRGLRKSAEPTSPVGVVIAKRIRELWLKTMKGESTAEVKLDNATKAAIGPCAVLLRRVYDLNKEVHFERYTALIADH